MGLLALKHPTIYQRSLHPKPQALYKPLNAKPLEQPLKELFFVTSHGVYRAVLHTQIAKPLVSFKFQQISKPIQNPVKPDKASSSSIKPRNSMNSPREPNTP